ncbi:hypothetical protein BBJ28_00023958 [Nothophytophthora sp. Chile5]|nr:hypothetical protein BBJ28_00023958 [Nothophytophthora sp. Chile5]
MPPPTPPPADPPARLHASALPHGPVKRSPLAGRVRRGDGGFPRAELWNWTDTSPSARGAKDDLIESMLRECVAPVAASGAASSGGNDRRLLLPLQRQRLQPALPPPQQTPPHSLASGSRRRVLGRTLQPQPPASQLQPAPAQPQATSFKNLVAAVAPATVSDGWKAITVAHRTNKILTKTRKIIDVLTKERGTATPAAVDEDPGQGANCDAVAEEEGAHESEENEQDSEDAREAAAMAVKFLAAKKLFEQEMLGDDDGETIGAGRKESSVDSGSTAFWELYKSSTTCKRPDSARGRYIANCQDASLLVLPVLDLKRPSRYERVSQALRYDNYYFGDKRAEALGDALHLLPVPVQTLSMKNVGVSGSGSSAIMSGLSIRQLKHLDFSENRLGTKGTLTIFRTLENTQVSLKSLNLGNNQLGDQAVKLLMQCLLNRCTLEHLDLRCNQIFHAAVSIGELLRITTPLKSLNLSWNNIRGEPAQHLARCMMENLTLSHLDLSDNTLGNNGNADAELGACLATNKSLRHLDISSNHVQAKSVLVYVDGLQHNTALETLVLRGNPIGAIGAEAILRAVASGSVSTCQMDLGDCNLEILDSNQEGSIYGGGVFNFNLGDRSDGILLRELLLLVWKNKAEVLDAVHNGMPFTFNRKDEKTLLTAIPSQGSMQLKLQPNYDRHEEAIPAGGFQHVVTLMKRSFGQLRDGDEAAKLFCIRVLAEEYTFTVAQANTLLALFESHTSQVEKANAAAALIPQILQTPFALDKNAPTVCDCASMEAPNEFFEDKDCDGKIDVCGDICMVIGLENLSDIEQSHVEQKVGKWISFNVNNPTGRYQLNMANPIDRRILMRILEVNKSEKKMRQHLKLLDTSQHGQPAQPLEGGFRNLRLNRLPMAMGAGWQFPRLGTLEFDFVMTRRPYACCTALNDAAFEQFLKEFKQLQVTADMKLVGLRSISTLYYFSCSQTQRIMEHFGTFERDPATGCLLRAEVLIVLFSRIVDEWNLSETLSLLDLATKTQVLDRLGVLNCFHPMQQIESYKQLQLTSFDQRQLVLLLVKLAMSGEAELTNVQLGGDAGTVAIEPEGWKTWTSDDKLPAHGALSCSMRALHAVQLQAQLPLTSVRKKLLQSLLFKLEDKAQELAMS